jgi:hypothetical protein
LLAGTHHIRALSGLQVFSNVLREDLRQAAAQSQKKLARRAMENDGRVTFLKKSRTPALPQANAFANDVGDVEFNGRSIELLAFNGNAYNVPGLIELRLAAELSARDASQ